MSLTFQKDGLKAGEDCSFGINLNKEEAEAFITELRSLIMQYQEPRHFIFAPHMHLAKD